MGSENTEHKNDFIPTDEELENAPTPEDEDPPAEETGEDAPGDDGDDEADPCEDPPTPDADEDVPDSGHGDENADPEPAARPPATEGKAFAKAVGAAARQVIARDFGEDFNELDPDHLAAYQIAVGDITAKHRQVQQGTNSIVAVINDNGGKELAEFIKNEKRNRTNGEIQDLEDAAARGDMGPSLEFVKACAEKYRGVKAAQEKAKGIKKETPARDQRHNPPPSLSGSGTPKPKKKDEIPFSDLLGRS